MHVSFNSLRSPVCIHSFPKAPETCLSGGFSVLVILWILQGLDGLSWLGVNSFTRWMRRLPHLSILCETNSGIWYARGGESIFYYQPAYRYMVFLQHLLLGDGDVLISALSVAAVNGGIFFATCQFFRQANSLLRRFMILGVFFLILFLVNANQVLVALVEMGSEFPTWVFLAFALGYIIGPKPARHWLIITILVGLGVITRTEQVLGFGLIYLLFLYKIRHAQPMFFGSFLVLIFICLLPAFQIYFGGQFEIFPTSKNIPKCDHRPVDRPQNTGKCRYSQHPDYPAGRIGRVGKKTSD